ncbi:MAG: endonuclease/exonuclease/phosphatase family protein [Clostridia bacterium]|nr:endonuclease/exonuclease/phosphatase family protein [Clostridia bacterium]
MKKVLKIILTIILIFLLVIVGYLAYVFLSYDRIEDNQELEVAQVSNHHKVPVGVDQEITTYNIGFCAYLPEFSFFMDGGTESRAFSKEAVAKDVLNIGNLLKKIDSDFNMIEEVDFGSTRSYNVDQKTYLQNDLNNYSNSFAVNYNSSYLFYPFTCPHGASKSGLLTLSKYNLESASRRSLPIQEDLAKFLDLDRCYSINRIPTENGKYLVLFTFHLSAYTTDTTIGDKQLEMLYTDMQKEYDQGNYVIAGGDFNKDLLGDSSKYFGISGEDFSWAKSFNFESLPDDFTLMAPLDKKNPIPSCRNCDEAWNPDTTFQITIDGFMVSKNIKAETPKVQDTNFAYSDHQPVTMTFKLMK